MCASHKEKVEGRLLNIAIQLIQDGTCGSMRRQPDCLRGGFCKGIGRNNIEERDK